MAELKVLKLLFFVFIFGLFDVTISKTSPCQLRDAQYGKVCVCTSDYCDYLEDPTPKTDKEFVVVTSTKEGLRFGVNKGRFDVLEKVHIWDHQQKLKGNSKLLDIFLANKVDNTRHVRLNINRDNQHQKIIGFGGALTGAVSYLIDHLPQNLQDHLYKSYYSEHGIGFNLLRMSIGGSDFDLAPWAYNELPENDTFLSNFTLDARDELKVKQIKQIMKVSEVKNLRIKGAAWSSPRWMKTNNKWSGHSSIKKEYFQTWAEYHLKWVELMKENGLPIWAISTGNEPLNGFLFMFFVKFMSLGWTPGKQAVWVAENLGPTIRKSKHKDLIIFGSDDQRYTLSTWFRLMKAQRPKSMDFINGIAVHFYWDEIFLPTFVDRVRSRFPDKIMLISESSLGDKPWHKAMPLLGSWDRGEKMARSFLQNLQHNMNGWIDWNLILDEKGGPNYVNNYCDAPVIVNMKNTKEIFKQPMFYVMGHFSKFVPENSIRIEAERSNINIDSVAFLRPDGTIAAILFNSGNAKVEITIADSVRGTIVVTVPARSINTILYR